MIIVIDAYHGNVRPDISGASSVRVRDGFVFRKEPAVFVVAFLYAYLSALEQRRYILGKALLEFDDLSERSRRHIGQFILLIELCRRGFDIKHNAAAVWLDLIYVQVLNVRRVIADALQELFCSDVFIVGTRFKPFINIISVYLFGSKFCRLADYFFPVLPRRAVEQKCAYKNVRGKGGNKEKYYYKHAPEMLGLIKIPLPFWRICFIQGSASSPGVVLQIYLI